MPWFHKPKDIKLGGEETPKKKDLPAGVWEKCPECEQMIYKRDLVANLLVCPKCNYYHVMPAKDRIAMLAEEGSFQELAGETRSADPLEFPEYAEKLKKSQKKTGLSEAIVVGEARIGPHPTALGVFDFFFMAGSMGSVVGERVTRLAEYALEKVLPLVICSAGGGGARMHECMHSLMQMAKTSAAMGRLKEEGIPYLSVITHPTMGGVCASFASLGDVIIAEPKALIGFAGPRVIEQTIGHRLPDGFQSSEFQLDHGMLDQVVERRDLKETVIRALDLLTATPRFKAAREALTSKVTSIQEVSSRPSEDE